MENSKIKYQILFDYGNINHVLDLTEWDTIDGAIKTAVSMAKCVPFRIIQVVWDPET